MDPVFIISDEDEPRLSQLLRLAAECITQWGPDNPIIDPELDTLEEPGTGSALAKELTDWVATLAKQAEKQAQEKEKGISFSGSLIQAGGDPTPTVTIEATREQLSRIKGPLPFFKQSLITITPFN